jgi:hypothetical protein
MIFEGDGTLLILPKISGETGEIHFQKAIAILDKSEEIVDIESLNRVVSLSEKTTFEKILKVNYN